MKKVFLSNFTKFSDRRDILSYSQEVSQIYFKLNHYYFISNNVMYVHKLSR